MELLPIPPQIQIALFLSVDALAYRPFILLHFVQAATACGILSAILTLDRPRLQQAGHDVVVGTRGYLRSQVDPRQGTTHQETSRVTYI